MTTLAAPVQPAGTRARTPAPESSEVDSKLAVLLGLLGVLVAAVGSWRPSFWGDEAATDMSARRSWSSLLLELRHVDAVHGTYYALMHVWVRIAGSSPFALRFPSAVALGLTVAAIVVLVRISGGRRSVALVLGIATMLLPRLSYQGEEARAYALDAAVAAWIVVIAAATIRGRLRPRTGWILLGALSAIGVYLFLYLGLMLLVVGTLVLTGRARRAHIRSWILTSAAVAVVSIPILVIGLQERSQVSFLARQTNGSLYAVSVRIFFGTTTVAVAGWLLIALTLLICLIRLIGASRRRAVSTNRQPMSTSAPSLTVIGAVWGLLPTLVLVGANPIAHELSPRYLTFAAPGIAMLIGLGLIAICRGAARIGLGRWPVPVIALLALAVVAPTWAAQRTPTSFNKSDWSTVGALVHAHAHTGDDVAFDVTVRPSRRELLALRTYPADFAGLREVQVTIPYWRNASWHDQALTVAQAAGAGMFTSGRLWLVQDAHGGSVDHEGESALAHAGFHIVHRWRAPTSELVELEH